MLLNKNFVLHSTTFLACEKLWPYWIDSITHNSIISQRFELWVHQRLWNGALYTIPPRVFATITFGVCRVAVIGHRWKQCLQEIKLPPTGSGVTSLERLHAPTKQPYFGPYQLNFLCLTAADNSVWTQIPFHNLATLACNVLGYDVRWTSHFLWNKYF